MSGSRGEANFVWKCKNCKVRRGPASGAVLLVFFFVSFAALSLADEPTGKGQPTKHMLRAAEGVDGYDQGGAQAVRADGAGQGAEHSRVRLPRPGVCRVQARGTTAARRRAPIRTRC